MISSNLLKTRRDLIVLSHANPEDNEFARWLALRLMTEGYPVWIDLINLKGGEDVWKTIEKTIRERAVKFLYVLSRTSNQQKEGVLQELSVAKAVARGEKLQDFIIPLHIDDLPFSEINIEINRQNAIPFEKGWSRGLKQLLEVLERERVAKHQDYTPSTATSWWREQFSAEKGVISEPEEYLSSWYLIKTLPQKIYFHLLHKTNLAKDSNTNISATPSFPFYSYKEGVLSFAPKEDFEGVVIDGRRIVDTVKYPVDQFLAGKFSFDHKIARNVVINLLEQAWLKMVEQRNLPIHEMANDFWCFHFTKDQVEKDKIKFMGVNGKMTYRSIVGYRKFRGSGRIRIWHFGISAKALAYPVFAFNIKPHVLFSDDGLQIWTDADKLHKARMNQCKNWWNDDWRDRILATVQWLTDGNGSIVLPISSEASVTISQAPLNFVSPVSYLDPKSLTAAEVEESLTEKDIDEVDESEESDEGEEDD